MKPGVTGRLLGLWSIASLLCALGCQGGPSPESAELAGARASDTLDAEPPTETAPLGIPPLLRRLSLDLRGHAPTMEEYEAALALGEIPESTVDAYLATDGFRLAMRELYETLLWPNPEGAQLLDGNNALRSGRMQVDGGQVLVYAIGGAARRALYRGRGDALCGPWLQEDYIDGVPVAEAVTDPDSGALLYRQEGYVLVHPYWAPETEIAVCAFDAQTAEISPAGVACDTAAAFRDVGCGCGEDLRWCYGPGVESQIWGDMREQVGRAVDRISVGGAPYTELLTSTALDMNGRLTYWKRHLAGLSVLNRTYNVQGPGDPTLPDDPSYVDEAWRTYERGDIHTGVLTMPAYTLRFQTNRARANRFRIAFTGQYFVPPTQPEDPATADCEAVSGDLTQMCTCRGCHQVLEPLAAHFGDVVGAGTTLLSDLNLYEAGCDPANYADPSRISRSCARLYGVSETDKNPGWRTTHQYAYMEEPGFDSSGLDDPIHRAIFDHINAGPQGLVAQVVGSGQLANATVKAVFQWLMGRPMNLTPSDARNEVALLGTLGETLEAEGDLRALVKAVVSLPEYRSDR